MKQSLEKFERTKAAGLEFIGLGENENTSSKKGVIIKRLATNYNVAKTTLERYISIINNGCDELLQKVNNRKIGICNGARIATFPKNKQILLMKDKRITKGNKKLPNDIKKISKTPDISDTSNNLGIKEEKITIFKRNNCDKIYMSKEEAEVDEAVERIMEIYDSISKELWNDVSNTVNSLRKNTTPSIKPQKKTKRPTLNQLLSGKMKERIKKSWGWFEGESVIKIMPEKIISKGTIDGVMKVRIPSKNSLHYMKTYGLKNIILNGNTFPISAIKRDKNGFGLFKI